MAATPTPSKPTLVDPAEEPESKGSAATGAQATGKSDGRLRWILVASAAAVLLIGSAAGVLWVRHRAHRLIAVPTAASPAKAEAPPQMQVDLPLDPFVVNLADAGGHSYARIGMTLQISMPMPEKTEGASAEGSGTERDATVNDLRDMVRDQIISVLNQQQSADLLAPDGKEHLKQAIQAAITAKKPQLKVLDIYFTEFLVQS